MKRANRRRSGSAGSASPGSDDTSIQAGDVLIEPVVSVIRRELRRLFPELKIESEAIIELLNNDILKREVLDGDKVKDAQQRVSKAVSKNAKAQAKKNPLPDSAHEPAVS